ncbi:HTH domain-containing protein [Natrarchaeobius chitinivorans]|uniref:Uncharacterized protein n=1 Tax=Natrarchaeobius chitinivorans TaxID=1679083 RepID=A0A3N6PFZ0_NATCH|nr:HTH domain-containing protein [Natrarchaeobius chitinivorans]RQG96605.1 hypothetical protein EA473_05710 [Natrarchaeobius chitinivorans]
MKDASPSPRTVELWIRSFAPATTGPTQERALERLENVESTSGIEATEVRIWGPKVERTERSRRIPQLRRIQERLDSFEAWATRTGRRLEPFFRRCHGESTIAGERHDVHRLPTVALAEFEDGDIVHVAPCLDGDRTVDVFDRFDELERRYRDDSVLEFGDERRTDGVISEQTGAKTNRSRPSPELPSPDSD